MLEVAFAPRVSAKGMAPSFLSMRWRFVRIEWYVTRKPLYKVRHEITC